MLVHICCSVDSHFFLQKLQLQFPNEPLIGFFYDPNIHPYSEYQLRLLDVQRSCQKLGIPLHVGDYDYEGWLNAVRGLEQEPEKGKRCNVCFDNRLETTALKALDIGEKTITTTLLTSPKKSIESLQKSLLEIVKKYDLNMVAPDFRKGGGTNEQFSMAKEANLYHQDYCGCLFALHVQRDQQHRLQDELSSPMPFHILPSSIEERIALYKEVITCEQQQIPFRLVREKFLNYRLQRAWVKTNTKEVIPSYFLFYSHFKKELIKGKVEYVSEGKGYFSKEEVLFLSLELFNTLTQNTYQNVKEMLVYPPSVEVEIMCRKALFDSFLFSSSPIIVLDKVDLGHYEIYAISKTYQDIRENLALIR
ncbi:MAG: epoxyqueuosine reductase QueH [Sulfurospirillaceae bacterium]|nr:epoxyqueuosine reductase QueH [Sulfurospirillaceae bacterium]MDD2825490.1 epoxyqueuosine reductase QueH [Sulfurospirillaceae bacterium]